MIKVSNIFRPQLGHFLFYPLVNTKIDLISYFEKINFDYRKISKLRLANKHKDIFRIVDLKTPYKRNSKSYGFKAISFQDFGDIETEKLSDHLIIKVL